MMPAVMHAGRHFIDVYALLPVEEKLMLPVEEKLNGKDARAPKSFYCIKRYVFHPGFNVIGYTGGAALMSSVIPAGLSW